MSCALDNTCLSVLSSHGGDEELLKKLNFYEEAMEEWKEELAKAKRVSNFTFKVMSIQ